MLGSTFIFLVDDQFGRKARKPLLEQFDCRDAGQTGTNENNSQRSWLAQVLGAIVVFARLSFGTRGNAIGAQKVVRYHVTTVESKDSDGNEAFCSGRTNKAASQDQSSRELQSMCALPAWRRATKESFAAADGNEPLSLLEPVKISQ